jgi:hypothetical protein
VLNIRGNPKKKSGMVSGDINPSYLFNTLRHVIKPANTIIQRAAPKPGVLVLTETSTGT